MSRNRIIHNVQDVLVGSTPYEQDNLITGVEGHEILKRLVRVQSFDYNIALSDNTAHTLGKAIPFSRTYTTPPQVELNLSYYFAGVDNEKRIGLNTNNENENSYDKEKCIVHDMAERLGLETSPSASSDNRNLYLIVNSKVEDIYKNVSPPHEELYNNTFTKNDLIDIDSPNYNVIVFQNSYLSSYKLSASVGSLTTVELSYEADSVVGYVSGSGISIPYLDLKKGEIEEGDKEFIIPKRWDRKSSFVDENYLSHHGDIIVSITPDNEEKVVENYLDDNIVNCDIDVTLDRERVNRIGYKLTSDRLIKYPIQASLSFSTQVKETISGSFLDNMDKNKKYNVEITFKHKSKLIEGEPTAAKYTFSGAKFNGVSYNSAIGSNQTASVNFTTHMDLENKTEGVFLSGKVSSLYGNVESEDGSSVIDNNSNTIMSMPVYPQY